MQFVFRGVLDPTKREVRTETRPDHLRYQMGFETLTGGPLIDGDDEATGSLTIFEADDLAAAQARIDGDPYMVAGIFSSWSLDAVRLLVWADTPQSLRKDPS